MIKRVAVLLASKNVSTASLIEPDKLYVSSLPKQLKPLNSPKLLKQDAELFYLFCMLFLKPGQITFYLRNEVVRQA
jgi:hypothetical protein